MNAHAHMHAFSPFVTALPFLLLPSRSSLISLVPSPLHWLSVACQEPVKAPAVRHTPLPLMTSDDTHRRSRPLEMTGNSLCSLLLNGFLCAVCSAF